MSALLLSADLACSSQVAGAAARLDIPLEVVMNAARIVECAAASLPAVVILDLNTPLLDCRELVPQLKDLASPPASIVAFGPHVHEARLAAAQEAGCDRVLARGQFYAQLEQILAAAQSR